MRYLIAMFCLLLCFSAYAEPKAYEEVFYHGEIPGYEIRFTLADGYVDASSLIMISKETHRKTVYEITGDRFEKDQRKFTSPKNASTYFLINGLDQTPDTTPDTLTGRFYRNEKGHAITLKIQETP